MIITIIAGARPNFMKIAPIIHAINQSPAGKLSYRLVHTGQHYDKNMSGQFFKELDIPEPDVNLEAGGGTQAEQTANIMVRFEKYLMEHPCDLVLVVGDVTSTLACSIVAKKLNTRVAHVEAGIRSGDMSMPEEINRIVTDSITDLFFTTSEVANQNLKNQGITEDRIHFVGNTMIDTLLSQQERFAPPKLWSENNLQPQQYIVLTLHRPNNVDDAASLKALLDEILNWSGNYRIVFPVHPRTAQKLDTRTFGGDRLIITGPMSYLQFNYLVKHAKAVITDSGGITEETTVMQIPCITLRTTTERPETVTMGTNELVGTDPKNIRPALERLLDGTWKKGVTPPLWDGKTAGRIVSILENLA